jgi:hypothetical protein
MEPQKLEDPGGTRAWKVLVSPVSLFSLPLIFAAVLFLPGCAAPGQPVTRRPPAPAAITDLSAHQSGNSVTLTFTLPKQTVQGRPLAQPPEMEIYREYVPASAARGTNAQLPVPPSLILTVPSQMAEQYRDGDRIRFSDQLSAADLSAHSGDQAVYMVRTRISKHDSANSNLVAVQIFPAPLPISDLQAQVTQSAINISWTPPTIPQAAALPPAAIHYRIYRALLTSADGAQKSLNAVPQPAPAASTLLGESDFPAYSDTKFTFGQTYAYSVRAVAQYESGSVESEDSPPLEVTPRDTFPPAVPTGLIAAVAPAAESAPAHADLSWDISPAPEVAGYNVYRSGPNPGSEDRWDRLTASPLLTPAFRDIRIVSGQQYFYRVTAVDRFGNESAPSVSVDVRVPATNE